MYNFLDHKLSPQVSSLSAALDDHEPDNLVSDNVMNRSRGYFAFSSTRPPVDIYFEFLCDIHIKYIKLQTHLGSHKTIGIELLTGTPLQPLCKRIFDEPGLIVCDSKYYSKTNPPTNSPYHLAFFKSFQHKFFTSTRNLCVRIIRTDSRSVPCLGSVEVWGNVATTCSLATKQEVYNMMNKSSQETISKAPESIISSNNCCDFNIPDDFKDALTFEVMALPMTLPSGSTIDQQTLEKCISNDASYGRMPSDPFTGLEFRPSRKPVLNIALKSRIDLFLLQYSNKAETLKIARTLGTSKQILELPPQKKMKLECEPSTGDNLEVAIAKVTSSESFMCFTKTDSQTIKNTRKTCDKCEITYNLYELTQCKHYFCKSCLLGLNNVCGKCKKKYSNNNVVKVNV